MSSMRWGDSDSSDEDEIKVSDLPVPGQTRLDDSPPARRSMAPPRPQTPPRRASHNNRTSYDRDPSRSTSKRNNKQSGQARGQQTDWKQMAKASSRFAPSAQKEPLDASAWMEQRRKKQSEEEEKERRRQEEFRKQQQEEKRSRRASQFSALKAAVQEIKEESSSLQKAASPQRPAPTKILTRPPDSKPKESLKPTQQPKMPQEGSWRKKERPASPDRSLDDSTSIQSSSTTSSRKSRRGQSGRGGGRDRRGSGRDGRGRSHERGRDSRGRSHERGGRGRDYSQRGGRKQDWGRGGGPKSDRGGRQGSGRVQAGKTQVVRTSSGHIEYHVTLEEDTRTKGELLPNGTVRLSRKKKTKQPHTSIQTKLEIGKPEEK